MYKVFLGCPTYDGKEYCLMEFIEGIRKLTHPNLKIVFVDNSEEDAYAQKIATFGFEVHKISFKKDPRDRVTDSRNLLRDVFLASDYDHFFSLEQDIIPEPSIIDKMIKNNKAIIAAPYCVFHLINNKEFLVPVAYDKHPTGDGLWYLSKDELTKPQLKSVMAFGLGCVMINREVIQKIVFRHAQGYDDMMFCKDAKELGYELYLDTTLKVNHLIRR